MPGERNPLAEIPPVDAVLDEAVLESILTHLAAPGNYEAYVACCAVYLVSRRWRAALERVLRKNFLRMWRLSSIAGEPSGDPVKLFLHARGPSTSAQAQQIDTKTTFVRAHAVQPTDTMPGLALRHMGGDVAALRRVNNLHSDMALRGRSAIFVPVSDPEDLVGARGRIVRDAHLLRDVIAVEDPGLPARSSLEDPLPGGEELGPAGRQVARGVGGAGAAGADAATQAAARRQGALALARRLGTDDCTAAYYLEMAGGDWNQAVRQHEEDLEWERGELIARNVRDADASLFSLTLS
ncbi:unnamed protein product [Pedinophyceae sp. YPF-701]|nr:unnamed protein product [Pedinophyceae sp. YPF-701]